MKAVAFLLGVIMALAYLVAACVAFALTFPFQLSDFIGWFLDSRYTPRK